MPGILPMDVLYAILDNRYNFNYRGEWSDAVEYAPGDVVDYGEFTYRAQKPNMGIPPINGATWALRVDMPSMEGVVALSESAGASAAEAAGYAEAAEISAATTAAIVAGQQASIDSFSLRVGAVETGQNSALVAYATQALLYADLAYPDKAVGLVTNDSTAANNGFYRKVGASGSGSWVQSSYDRVAVLERLLETYPAGSDVGYQLAKALFNSGAALASLIQSTGTYTSAAAPTSVVAGYAFACVAPAQKFNLVRAYVTTENSTVLVRLSIKDKNMVTLAKATAIVRGSGWAIFALSTEIDPATLPDGVYYVAIESVGHVYRIYRANFTANSSVLASVASYPNKYTRTTDADSNIWTSVAGTNYQGLIETFHTKDLSTSGILTSAAMLKDTVTDYVADPDSAAGYINLAGSFITSATWRTSPFVAVSQGQKLKFTGYGNAALVASMSLWDADQEYLGSGYAYTGVFTDIEISITNLSVAYVRFSSASTYPFAVTRSIVAEALVPRLSQLQEQIDNLDGAEAISAFVPEQAYALQGEPLYMYARGIVADRAASLAWNVSQANEDVCKITPASTAPISVKLRAFRTGGEAVDIAAFDVLVTGVPLNPVTPRNVICLGDSLTEGVSAAGIQGAYVNELSRRLTGVGTALLAGAQSPAPLALSNIKFRGTRGDQPVLHEGRGGWRASNYLTSESVSGVTNAFYNPGTGQFDLNYYLEQNGFDIGSTADGVVADGSNLTVIILLGWNDVYSATAESSAADLSALIDKIKLAKSAAEIIVVGLNPAPRINLKSWTTGERYVSEREVFEVAIRQFGEAYRTMCKTKVGVDFLQISHVFNPEISYQSATREVSLRSAITQTGVTDHVHPAAVGYAQLADALFYKLLYDHCR